MSLDKNYWPEEKKPFVPKAAEEDKWLHKVGFHFETRSLKREHTTECHPDFMLPFDYYAKSTLAGGICAESTHAAGVPIDVVKTRMQLDPAKYRYGLMSGMRKVVSEEGIMALSTGLGATLTGYFIQGGAKFGGNEFFKTYFTTYLGERYTWKHREMVYIASGASAEFVASSLLTPFEATRIRAVSNPSYGSNMLSVGARLVREEGFARGLYSGFAPMLFKQIPYSVVGFLVQGETAEAIYTALGKTPGSVEKTEQLGITLASGIVAGVASAVASHPADTLLSKLNKAGEGGSGGALSRMFNIAASMGPIKLLTTGLLARTVMVTGYVSMQFLMFDSVLMMFGIEKFHFTDPSKKEHH
eukprot:gene404-115_t